MNLKKFFNPSSIAIVGVSHTPQKVGHLVAKNILAAGYKGDLYFINPSGEEILGKKTFKNIHAIKKKIDLTILAIPADASLSYFEHIHAVGCKNVVLYAAGFNEGNDEEGMKREQQLIAKAEQYGITLLGPNCIGFINTLIGINATFLKYSTPKGPIGFVSQSGALGSVMVDYFSGHKNMGFSYFVSIGNKTIIDESDVLEFLAESPDTKVIAMYLEGVKNGEKFRQTLEKAAKLKPVVILKSGTTEEGSKAALSHTGGLVGNDDIFDAIVHESGAIRADSFVEFMTILKLYNFNAIPRSKNILVLSNAGGAGVLLADELIHNKLHLTTVSEETKQSLNQAFDTLKKITVHNPIDLLGDASAFDYQQAITSTLKEEHIGATVILLTPQANTQIMETAYVLANSQLKIKHPIYPIFMGEASVREAHQFFEEKQLASFFMFDSLPSALAKVCNYAEFHASKKHAEKAHSLSLSAHTLDIKALLLHNHGKPFLNQYDSLKVMKYSGLDTVETFLAHSEEDLQHIIEKIGFPVVAKIASDKITHKTEVKGVVTNINTYDELVQAYDHLSQLTGKKNQGCYVQQMVSGHELFAGAKRDNTFGIVVIVGLGGIYAELTREMIQFVHPFSFDYFANQIEQSKMQYLVKGFRNTPPLDLKQLYQVAQRLSNLCQRFDAIKEVDINPLFSNGKIMKVADARIILS